MTKLTDAIRTKCNQAQAIIAVAGDINAKEFIDELLEMLSDADQVSKIANIANARGICAICNKKVPINRRAVYGEHVFHTHCAARAAILSHNLINRMQEVLNTIATTEPPADVDLQETITHLRNFAAAGLGLPQQVLAEDRGEAPPMEIKPTEEGPGEEDGHWAIGWSKRAGCNLPEQCRQCDFADDCMDYEDYHVRLTNGTETEN